MIEKVRIFSKKPLHGLIKIEDKFQIYSEDMEIKEELPISEREYPPDFRNSCRSRRTLLQIWESKRYGGFR